MHVSIVMVMSADGYITKHDTGLVDWSSKEDKKHFSEVTKKKGVIIYGNSTFKTFNRALPGRLNIVMTRTPDMSKNLPDELEYTNQEPQAILDDLKRRGYTEVAVVGGAQINTLFLKQGLIDDVHLTIEPFLFGAGKRLSEDLKMDLKMELVEQRLLNDNSLVLHYRVLK